MAKTTKGYGTIVEWSANGSTGWLPIAQIRDIGGAGGSREEVDTSHMLSPGQYKEREGDWRDSTPMTLDLLFTEAEYQQMWNVFMSETVMWWRITIPEANAKKDTFQGYVSEISREIAMQGRIGASVEIAISGPIYKS